MMSEKKSKALVPVKKVLPPAVKGAKDTNKPFELVNGNLKLTSRDEVRSLLPDILGKVLARVWLDSSFHREFSQDPQKTLEINGVADANSLAITSSDTVIARIKSGGTLGARGTASTPTITIHKVVC